MLGFFVNTPSDQLRGFAAVTCLHVPVFTFVSAYL